MGDATIRHRGDGEASPDLEALANWCDQLRDEKDKLPSIRGSLINGVLWAAEQHLDNVQNLAAGHADAWLPLARWGAGEFLGIRMGAEGRANVITAVTCVLKMTWPDEERRRLYEELGGIIERVIREGEVGQFSMLHFELKEELGQRRYTERHGGTGRRTIAPSDELMVRLCRASAERVVGWRRAGETTQDLGYGACLWGGDTADLLEHVYEYARDRDFVRRELAPIIDILAGAGLTPMATDLRLKIRRA